MDQHVIQEGKRDWIRRVLDQAEAPSPVRLSKQTLEMPLGGTCEAFKVHGVQNQKT
jgi:hypothetical protein